MKTKNQPYKNLPLSPYPFVGTPLGSVQDLESGNILLRWQLLNYELALPRHRMVNQLSKRHYDYIKFRDIELQAHTQLLNSYVDAAYGSVPFESTLQKEAKLLNTYLALKKYGCQCDGSDFDFDIQNDISQEYHIPSMVILPYLTMILRSLPENYCPIISIAFAKLGDDKTLHCRIEAPGCFLFNYTDEAGIFKEASLVEMRQKLLQNLLGTTFVTRMSGDIANSTKERNILAEKVSPGLTLDVSIPILAPEDLRRIGVANDFKNY